MIFFIKFAEHAFNTLDKFHDAVYMLVGLAILLPLSMINDITPFAKVSVVANIIVVLTIFFILGMNISEIPK